MMSDDDERVMMRAARVMMRAGYTYTEDVTR
jgi:hypothetical protein